MEKQIILTDRKKRIIELLKKEKRIASSRIGAFIKIDGATTRVTLEEMEKDKLVKREIINLTDKKITYWSLC